MIQVGEFRIIKKDALNWSIEQSYEGKEGTKKKTLWKVLGWYPTLKMTIPRFIDVLIGNEYKNLESIEELLETMNDIAEAILDELEGIKDK